MALRIGNTELPARRLNIQLFMHACGKFNRKPVRRRCPTWFLLNRSSSLVVHRNVDSTIWAHVFVRDLH